MAWYNEFNAVFWITLTTLITGSIGLALKFCLKSKCKNFSCCFGMLTIDRDVEIEMKEEMKAMELGLNNSPLERRKSDLSLKLDDKI